MTEAVIVNDRIINDIYPVTTKLAKIGSGQKAALIGFGLSSMDALATLTLGRGGTYEPDPADSRRLIYRPSGREPEIVMFSRSGLPYLARPHIHEGNHPPYQAVIFTKEHIDRLRSEARSRTGSGKLDWEKEVLPYLLDEMTIRYYYTYAYTTGGIDEADKVKVSLLQAWQNGALQSSLTEVQARYGAFDPAEVLITKWPTPVASPDEYQEAFKGWLQADFDEGLKGIYASPYKAARELFRDLRNTIRYAVDFGGLTPESHRTFLKTYVPLSNRLVTGPQKERIQELLALIEAQVVKLPFGSSAQVTIDESKASITIQSTIFPENVTYEADYLISAFSDNPSVELSDEPLIDNLFRQGRIRVYSNGETYVGGIELNEFLQPVNAQGEAETNFWVLGSLSEGIKYYNHYVSTPNAGSRSILDAELCVSQFFDRALGNKTHS